MIKLLEDEKNKFILQRYLVFDFKKLKIKKPNFQQNLSKELDSLLKLSRTEYLQNWFDQTKIPQTTVNDFKERIFETPSGKVLLGIRFLGMDTSKPFVNIWASFPIENELENIIVFVRQSFKIFKPLYIRFWLNPKNKLAKSHQKHICQNYLVGNINEICQKPKPLNFEEIELENFTNLDFYTWYEKMYTNFHDKNPILKSYVTSISKTIFQESIKQNLCYYIRYKGEKIGIIAAEKDNYFGVNSLYMNEIILQSEYRNKKLATASQRQLIECNQTDFACIWGTIDNKNMASLRNALRVGREIISVEILLPI